MVSQKIYDRGKTIKVINGQGDEITAYLANEEQWQELKKVHRDFCGDSMTHLGVKTCMLPNCGGLLYIKREKEINDLKIKESIKDNKFIVHDAGGSLIGEVEIKPTRQTKNYTLFRGVDSYVIMKTKTKKLHCIIYDYDGGNSFYDANKKMDYLKSIEC